LRYLKIAVEIRAIDLRDWQPEPDSADSVIFSHVLTENIGDVLPLISKALRAVCESGRVLIVERADDAVVWDAIDRALVSSLVPVTTQVVQIETGLIPKPHPQRIAEKRLLRTRYSTIHVPDRVYYTHLLGSYFRAWNEQSIDLLDEIFAPDAIYHEKPHEEPIKGLAAIKRYWDEHVLQQREISARVCDCAYVGNRIFAQWAAEFIYRDERINVKGILVLTIDSSQQRIQSLYECFRTKKLQAGL
jgi:hypothetical protein